MKETVIRSDLTGDVIENDDRVVEIRRATLKNVNSHGNGSEYFPNEGVFHMDVQSCRFDVMQKDGVSDPTYYATVLVVDGAGPIAWRSHDKSEWKRFSTPQRLQMQDLFNPKKP